MSSKGAPTPLRDANTIDPILAPSEDRFVLYPIMHENVRKWHIFPY